MKPIASRTIFALLAIAASLTACGGGGGGSDVPPPVVPPVIPPPSNEVPTSATATTQAYVQYIGSLLLSDGTEPLDVSKVTPPTSETEEPRPVS